MKHRAASPRTPMARQTTKTYFLNNPGEERKRKQERPSLGIFCEFTQRSNLGVRISAGELAARTRVRKRDVSFGPRTAVGAQCWDTFQTLYGTAKKLGVNFYEYICERVRGAPPKLPELIASRAQQVPLGASWNAS